MSEDERRARQLREMLAHREIAFDLELILERRVRSYGEQLNARLARRGDTDLCDLTDDRDLAQLIALLCEAALDAETERSGIAAVFPHQLRGAAKRQALPEGDGREDVPPGAA